MAVVGDFERTAAITSSFIEKESNIWKKLRFSRNPKHPKRQTRPKQVLSGPVQSNIKEDIRQYQLLTLPSFSEISLSLTSTKPPCSPRPKHIPIITPSYDASITEIHKLLSPAYAPCLRGPVSPDHLKRSISKISAAECKESIVTTKVKSRHVEIVIPIWAHPIYKLPPRPPGLSNINPTGKESTSSPAFVNAVKMQRRATNDGRNESIDSGVTVPSSPRLNASHSHNSSQGYSSSVNSSQTSLSRQISASASAQPNFEDAAQQRAAGAYTTGQSPVPSQTAGISTPSTSAANLSGLVCNVHQTTGRRPHALVGASTTILGDKLYVFGGRRLSPAKPVLSSAVYELDLIKRHWTQLQARGQIPSPRYFHSLCALDDTKLVCYGGMSLAFPPSRPNEPTSQAIAESQFEMVVMGDVHIFDVGTRIWTRIATPDAPQGRYAHCAAVVPSSSVFSSASAPLSAIHHNRPVSNSYQDAVTVGIDGSGGAQLIVVGGQDNLNRYIEQISIFNLRSLRWTATEDLGRACGAYRSVVTPLAESSSVQTNRGTGGEMDDEGDDPRLRETESSVLIYSNYNFQDVKLELHVREPDGTLTEQPMRGGSSPPGLRFPTGVVINNHFVISGTLLTSSKQEYALWALDLTTMTWSRIDVGGTIFGQGSWNRGVLWRRRNTFVILGNRKRNLVEDYNQRRLNFANVCMVELEAFGLYENPRKLSPSSGFKSASAPIQSTTIDRAAGGRQQSRAAEQLGQMALGLRELCDMEFLAIGGERLPVNSHLIARRWGPYFTQLLREGIANQDGVETALMRPGILTEACRASTVTITPSVNTAMSTGTTLIPGTLSGTSSTLRSTSSSATVEPLPISAFPATTRPRTLYLPHTLQTLQALTHYLYTSSLPVDSTPQVLCSLLQLARPYRIDGLLEAVIEQLHRCLDGRNTAAIFNAAAMAAGGGDGVRFFSNSQDNAVADDESTNLSETINGIRINTDVAAGRRQSFEQGDDFDAEVSSPGTASTASSFSESNGFRAREEVWRGGISAVVGLQKRGLRGLMEGRRMRERVGTQAETGPGGGAVGEGSAGLGIS